MTESEKVNMLINRLSNENSKEKLKIIEELKNLQDIRAINPLIQCFRDSDEDVRVNAAKAVTKFGQASVHPLIQALEDKDYTIRYSAKWALGVIGEAAVESLIQNLKHDDPDVRMRVAEALGDIKDSRAIAPLIEALHDENDDVQFSAGVALEVMGKSAEKALIQASKRGDKNFKKKVKEILKNIRGDF